MSGKCGGGVGDGHNPGKCFVCDAGCGLGVSVGVRLCPYVLTRPKQKNVAIHPLIQQSTAAPIRFFDRLRLVDGGQQPCPVFYHAGNILNVVNGGLAGCQKQMPVIQTVSQSLPTSSLVGILTMEYGWSWTHGGDFRAVIPLSILPGHTGLVGSRFAREMGMRNDPIPTLADQTHFDRGTASISMSV